MHPDIHSLDLIQKLPTDRQVKWKLIHNALSRRLDASRRAGNRVDVEAALDQFEVLEDCVGAILVDQYVTPISQATHHDPFNKGVTP